MIFNHVKLFIWYHEIQIKRTTDKMNNDKVKTVSPENSGDISHRLSQIESIIKEGYDNMEGIIITKDGYKVYEKYLNGSDTNKKTHIASVTKSILSILMGIAIYKGIIKDESQRVMDFFKEYDFKDKNEIRYKITIKDLLTMRVPYTFEDYMEPLEDFTKSKDWIRFALESIDKKGELGKFKYSTMGAHLLSAILTKASGISAKEFANKYLFAPLEIEEIDHKDTKEFNFDTLFGEKIEGWANDPMGISAGGFGLKLSTRDMIKIGELYLNKGEYKGKRIVSEEWINKTLEENGNGYGYLWYLIYDIPVKMYAALGDGGNMICVIPNLKAVIAMTSSFMMNAKDRIGFVIEHILPALS